jgi:hypothetical protein
MLEKVELVISGQFRETCNIGHKIKNNKIKNQITDKQNKELTVENLTDEQYGTPKRG